MSGSRIALLAVVGWLAASPHPALAQDPPPACAAMDTTLPPTFSAWTAKAPLAAATSIQGLDGARLTPGVAVRAALPPMRQIAYAIAAPTDGSGDRGGMFRLDIAEAGAYRIAMGSGGWIDVIGDGKALESIDHGRGPACSTIGKFVTFDLKPGRYTVQISDAAEAAMGLLAVRSPAP